MRDKFWIIFIILLVVSITPISATERNELNNEIRGNNALLDQSGKGVVNHGYNIKGFGEAIIQCVVNIFHSVCFIAENIWKWWNWDDVWYNIWKIGINAYNININIDNTSDESFGILISTLILLITSIFTLDTAIKFKDSLSKEENSDLNIQQRKTENNTTLYGNTVQSNQTNNETIQNNIMVSYNAKLNIQEIPIDQLQRGDVVIYKSQGKYTRYLQFIAIENESTPSEGFFNNELMVKSPIVILNGPYNKLIKINYNTFKENYNGVDRRGDPQNPKASFKRVNDLYLEQKNIINNNIKDNQRSIEDVNNSLTIAEICFYVFLGVLGVGIIGAIITWLVKRHYEKKANEVKNIMKEKDWSVSDGEEAESSIVDYGPLAGAGYYKSQLNGFKKIIKNCKIPLYAFFGLIVIGFLGDVASGIAYLVYKDDLKDLNNKDNNFNNDLADLNSWAVTNNLTPPVAGSLNFTTHEGCPVNEFLNGTSVYDSPLGYNNISNPLNGKLNLDPGNPGSFGYKSNPDFTGTDTFFYIVKDLDLDLTSNVANVTIM